MNVHAKTALTEPARTRRWQLSEAGTRVARYLTLNRQCRVRKQMGKALSGECRPSHLAVNKLAARKHLEPRADRTPEKAFQV